MTRRSDPHAELHPSGADHATPFAGAQRRAARRAAAAAGGQRRAGAPGGARAREGAPLGAGGHWAILCPLIMATRPWHGHTPAAQASCSQARDSERDRARLETELELETERAFNLGSGTGSRCSSYPPSPALSSTSGTPAMISPRLLTLPYSPGLLRRENSSDAPSGRCDIRALRRGTSESSLSGAESVSVSALSRPDSAGGLSNPATPGRATREQSPHSAGKSKQTGS